LPKSNQFYLTKSLLGDAEALDVTNVTLLQIRNVFTM